MNNTSNSSDKSPTTVKEPKGKPKERTLLKRIMFLEKGHSYASLVRLLRDEYDTQVSRQYLYGIITGRLTPSYHFALILCKALGITNVFTVFEQNEIHLPDFKTADTYSEETSGEK